MWPFKKRKVEVKQEPPEKDISEPVYAIAKSLWEEGRWVAGEEFEEFSEDRKAKTATQDFQDSVTGVILTSITDICGVEMFGNKHAPFVQQRIVINGDDWLTSDERYYLVDVFVEVEFEKRMQTERQQREYVKGLFNV